MYTRDDNGTRRFCAGAFFAALALCVTILLLRPGALAESDGMIRVKLTRLGAPSEIELSADCDYVLALDAPVRIPAGTRMTVAASGGRLTMSAGGKTLSVGPQAKLLRAASGGQGLHFLSPSLSNVFCGDLTLSAAGESVGAVLSIYIEDYLYGVVGCEMSPSSGIEALKAQAVACRSYALRKKATRATAEYDVTDAAADQVFKGFSGDASKSAVIRAVDDTKGCVLYTGSALAACYSCQSNGGQTESGTNAFGTAIACSAVRDDPYDLEGGGEKRTAVISMDASDLNDGLRQALLDGMADQLEQAGMDAQTAVINAVESVSACNARFDAPSRLYGTLTFRLGVTAGERTGTVTVDIPTYGAFEKWYGLSINDSDNETIWVAQTDRAFEVTFRRSGHGVGLSRCGAQAMAGAHGMTCAQILEYYYPGTTVKKLQLRDTTHDAGGAAPQAAPAALPQSPVAQARLSRQVQLFPDDTGAALPSASLAAGAWVDIYGASGDWAAVGCSGKYGYVDADALAAVKLTDAEAVPAPSQTFVSIAPGGAKLLRLPVDGALQIAALSEGASLRLYATAGLWAMVDTEENVTGFVLIDSLILPEDDGAAEDGMVTAPEDLYAQALESVALYEAPEVGTAVLEVLIKGSVVKVLSYNSAWAQVRTDTGLQGYAHVPALEPLRGADPSKATEAAEPGIDGGPVTWLDPREDMTVHASSLNLYREPSTASEVLAALSKGDGVSVIARNEKWAYVEAGGQKGCVLLSGLEAAKAAGPEGGEVKRVRGERTVYAARDDVPLYAAYDESAQVLLTLMTGDGMTAIAYNQKWGYVESGGVKGYVLVADVALEDPRSHSARPQEALTEFECDARVIGKTPLYEGADLSGEALTELPADARVRVTAYNDSVVRLVWGEYQGYAARGALERVK